MNEFSSKDLEKLYKPAHDSQGEDNGLVTIIGGSELFHGAPILSLIAASRIVDMVFFSSPEKSMGYIAENIKSQLSSFIWVPFDELEKYIEKSDAILIGPGFMRYKSETTKNLKQNTENILDEIGDETRKVTEKLLTEFPGKKWVIDAGSLQTMDAEWIPKNAILTPNRKEYLTLFGKSDPQNMSEKYNCTIVDKGPETIVYSPRQKTVVKGGNPGLTKGGTGDVLAGLTVGLFAKNNAHLAACAASFVLKQVADEIYKAKGTFYNADDLASAITLKR